MEYLLLFLLFCPNFHALKVPASVNSIYYNSNEEDCHVLFSSIDYGDEDNLNVLPRLVAAQEYRIHECFQNAFLDELQIAQLYHRYFSHPRLHSLMLPLKLVQNHPFLQDLIDFSIYKPGRLYIGNIYHYRPEDLSNILNTLGEHPENCGDLTTYEVTQYFEMPYDWKLSRNDQQIRQPASGIFEYLHALFTRTRLQPSGSIEQVMLELDSMNLLDPKLSTSIRAMLTSSSWEQHYETVRDVLRIQGDQIGLDPARQALWEGILLAIILRKEPDSERLKMMIADYFGAYQAKLLPSFILPIISSWTCHNSIYFDGDQSRSITEAISLSIQLSPTAPVFGGGPDDYVRTWRNYLRSYQHEPTPISYKFADWWDFILWWGDYHSLLKHILFDPNLQQPLVVKEIKYYSMPAVLEEVTAYFTYSGLESQLHHPEGYPIEKPLDRQLLRAFARTLVCNLLYLKAIRFNLPLQFARIIYDDVVDINRPDLIYLRTLLNHVDLHHFIPEPVLQECFSPSSPPL